MGFLGGNRLACKDQVQRTTLTHKSRQTLRSAPARQKAQLHLGLSKSDMLSGDPDRTRHCRLATTTQRKAIDRRDYRLAEVFDEIQHTLPIPAGLLRIVGTDI